MYYVLNNALVMVFVVFESHFVLFMDECL